MDRKSTILRSTEHFEYLLYISDKKEINSIANGNLNIFPDQEIVAYGDTKITEKTASEILEKPRFAINLYSNKAENVYRCYCCPKNTEDKIGHRTALNAWECLMLKLNNPTLVIITKRKIYAANSV